MLVKPDCIPCYLNQILNTLRAADQPEQTQNEVLIRMLPEIEKLAADRTPSYNSTLILHQTMKLIGVSDPFLRAKSESNHRAEKALETARRIMERSQDRLMTALKLAVAGNVIDLGIFDGYDIESSLEAALGAEFDPDAAAAFEQYVQKAASVLVVGDNSGEIVFDRILVQHLIDTGKSVIYSVKSGPILNDATMLDAEETGMCGLVPVIGNGNAFLGTEWELCADEFQHAFRHADLVIAKGQANYESLAGTRHAGEKTFFLLKAKCPVVAADLGVAYGTWVLRQNRTE